MKNFKTQTACPNCKNCISMWLYRDIYPNTYYFCNADKTAPEDIKQKNYDDWEDAHQVVANGICDLYAK